MRPGVLPAGLGGREGRPWGAPTSPRPLPQELREARQAPGIPAPLCPPPCPAWPTLAAQAPAERAGFTDTRAPWRRPPPQGTRPALVRAAQQHPRDDPHQLPDHSPGAVGPAGQAVGREEEGLQVVRELVPVRHGAAGVRAAVDQLPVLRAGDRQGDVNSTGGSGQDTARRDRSLPAGTRHPTSVPSGALHTMALWRNPPSRTVSLAKTQIPLERGIERLFSETKDWSWPKIQGLRRTRTTLGLRQTQPRAPKTPQPVT